MSSVVIAVILDEQGMPLGDSIGDRYIHCDVMKETDMEAAIRLALALKGQLDIIFNNASIGGAESSITRLDADHVKHVVSVNVWCILHGINHAITAMIEGQNMHVKLSFHHERRGGGGRLGGHAYMLSKEAILEVMKSTVCELGMHGIRVNCISPHGVPSDMLRNAYRKFLGKADFSPEDVGKIVGERGSLLQGRNGSTENVALTALLLDSDDSGFVTGYNLVIDGGYNCAFTTMSFIYK